MSKIDNTELSIPKTEENNEGMSWINFFLILMAIVLFRVFVLEPHSVSGSSMDNTFKNNDYVLVDKVSYRFENPNKGDVVVFNPPESAKSKDRFIKRVIAIPGDTIEIKENVTYVNDKPIEEKFITYTSDKSVGRTELKDNQYFVMGDNRYVSYDSRYWGPITKDEIQGRVLLRLYPFNKIGLFPGIKEYK